ncbi:MAG TPA: YdeI/OmpD-associated family protein [Pyrinomonadaceae bacterium]
MTRPKFFKTQPEFHDWLDQNHDLKNELLVGFHKKDSGKKSITYPEALDEALCYGWIDGVRKNINETSYTIRFTPRKPRSIWSLVNVRHVERLKKEGRMLAPGLRAFAAREDKRTGVYAFENKPRELSAEYKKKFQMNKQAWEFFHAQPPYYVKVCSFWVMNAKKEETQLRRLDQLIDISAKNERLGLLTSTKK